MKVAALVSGGKDSILSLLFARRYGHTPVVLVNMQPAAHGHDDENNNNTCSDGSSSSTSREATAAADEVHEVDSYMYQTVGHEAVALLASCMQLPLRRGVVRRGQARDVSMHYGEHLTAHNNNNNNNNKDEDEDEVEALYALLAAVKSEFADVQAVTSGAILSNYQRHRVEHVCARLGLVSLAYLWQRSGEEVVAMAAQLRVTAVLVKTASIGLQPRQLLGRTLAEATPTLRAMAQRHGAHMAGEGGEYETMVLDCPLCAQSRLCVTSLRCVMVDDNAYAPCGYAVLSGLTARAKTADECAADARVLARLTGNSSSTRGRSCCRSCSGGDEENDTQDAEEEEAARCCQPFCFASDRMAALPDVARVRAALDDTQDNTTTSATTTTTTLDWQQLRHAAAAVVADDETMRAVVTSTCDNDNNSSRRRHRRPLLVERVYYDEAVCVPRAPVHDSNDNDKCEATNDAAMYTAVAATARRLLSRIDDDMCAAAQHVCAYTVYLRDVRAARAFRDVYAQQTRWVRPPCCSLVFVRDDDGGDRRRTSEPLCIRVCAAAAATTTAASNVCSDVLHAQSRSCWAAAALPAGPYAQAWHVRSVHNTCNSSDDSSGDDDSSKDGDNSDGEAMVSSHLLTAIVLGREPVHCALATVDNLCGNSNSNNNNNNDEDGTTAERTLTPFAVQFAYSYANCAAYVSYFGKTMCDVTHTTVYMTPRARATTADVMAMWRCCHAVGGSTYRVAVDVVCVDALHESEDDAVVGLCVQCRCTS